MQERLLISLDPEEHELVKNIPDSDLCEGDHGPGEVLKWALRMWKEAPLKRGSICSSLKEDRLTREHTDELLAAMRSRLNVESVPEELKKDAHQGWSQITKELWRLGLYVARESRGWSGLEIGFPGSAHQLTVGALRPST